MRSAFIAIMALLLVPALAFAAQGDKGKRERGGRGANLTKNLDLTEKQLEQASAIRKEISAKSSSYRSDTQKKKKIFDDELQKEKPDDKLLKKLISELGQLSAKQTEARLEMKMRISAILTADQKKKLAEQPQRRMRGDRGDRGNRKNRGDRGDKKRRRGQEKPPPPPEEEAK